MFQIHTKLGNFYKPLYWRGVRGRAEEKSLFLKVLVSYNAMEFLEIVDRKYITCVFYRVRNLTLITSNLKEKNKTYTVCEANSSHLFHWYFFSHI